MSLLNDPMVERIGWVLVHSTWLLAIPAAIYGVLLWLTPQSVCRLRYAAGVATLAIMALLPPVSAPFIVVTTSTADGNDSRGVPESLDWQVQESVGPQDMDLRERSDSIAAMDDTIAEVEGDERRFASAPNSSTSGSATIVEPNESKALPDAGAVVNQAGADDAESNAGVRLGDRMKPFLPWAVAVWIVGVLLMSVRLLTGWRLTRKLKRTGGQAVPEVIEVLFADLKQRIGGCKTARILQSAMVSVPSIVGHFRPVVLLPVSAITGLSEAQLRAIVAHELAHVRRHDYLLNICQTVIETLLYYHPAVWWVSRCVREEREHCCDDVALKHGCKAAELARALVTVDTMRPAADQDLIESTLIPAADGGTLLRRVRRLAGISADKHLDRRSWIAGCVVLGLAAVVLTATINLKSVAQETSNQVVTQQASETASESKQSIKDILNSEPGRLDFGGGYFVELAAIRDPMESELEVDTVRSLAWNTAGDSVDTPFFGVQVRPGLAVPENQIARKFYVRAQMPKGAEVDLDVAGERTSGSAIQSSSDSDWKGVAIEASTIALFPDDQQTADLTVKLTLPAWRTLASFDFAGGVKNGIIMDREQKVSEFSRYTATGKFGPNATEENIRIIAFDRQHRQLEIAETSSEESDGKLTELNVAFKNSEGHPGYIVVQRRIETRPVVFRNVPLSPGKKPNLKITISGVDEDATSPNAYDSSPRPLKTLLTEPFEPLAAQLPGAGTMRLISVREAETDSPGWHADGSPRLVPFRDEELRLSGLATRGNKRRLKVFFEFVASSSDTRVGRVYVRPFDGSGAAARKAIEKGDEARPGVRLLQALNILDDRETEDFAVDVFAGALRMLATLPIDDPPDDGGDKSLPGNEYDSAEKSVAFLINEPRETRTGVHHSVSVILSEEVPQGVVLTGITNDGERVDGFVNSARDRKIVGTFIAPAGQRLESVEIATQPRHSMVFRNVSVWSGLGSSAFVAQSEPAAIDFDSVTPSRVFLLPSGERIAEQDGQGVGVSPALAALDEIERRGGLFRFDAEAEAPTGDTLPYLTEIRWRDFRADELRWVRPLAGLKRLQLSSAFTTDESLRSIEHLESLEEIEISQSRHLTTGCLKSIGKLTELRELQLVSSLRWNEEGYDPEDFKHLEQLTKIVEWEPYDWRMDDAGIAWLEDAEDLNLIFGWGPEITDDGFAALAGKPNLGVIRLGTTKITDASLALLENHPKLYWLQCSSPNLTDNAIDSVITMSNLRDLHLQESRVTDRGIQKLIDAIDKLPSLEKVNLIDTPVSQEMVRKLRAARQGLQVFAGEPLEGKSKDEKGDKKSGTAEPENASEVEQAVDEQDRDTDDAADLESKTDSSSKVQAAVAAPQNVTWPDKKWAQSLPPSGSGIRVKLDDRRWVEFNSVYVTEKVDGQRTKVHWTADGELMDPPADFDPTSLVPDRDGGEMPGVTRGFLMQVVGPKGTQIALDTSGVGGYGNFESPVGNDFVQIPVDKLATSIGYNQAYVEVKVSQEVKELISLDDTRFQVLTDPDNHQVYIVTENVLDFAWRLMIDRNGDGDAVGIEPFLRGGHVGNTSSLPDELKSKLKDNFQEAQLLGFSFDKDQPIPKLESLQRSPCDVVRFDNLSVFPGPRTAVVVSVNGMPIDEKNRPEISPIENVELNNFDRESPDGNDFDTITLTGTVVDENGIGIGDCWVGLFIEPQEYEGQSTRSPRWAKEPLSAFGDGPPLAIETRSNALGQFTFDAPKTHFVFEGEIWAMRPDGTLGNQWINAVWSHVQQPNNLKIEIADDESTIQVVDPEGKPIANADVTLQAFRGPRRVIQRLPEAVQRRTKAKTDDSGQVTFGGMETASVRGVAVSASGFGTQFLSDRLAANWVRDNRPLTLKLQPTASLRGQVLDFDPQLDEGLLLQASTEQSEERPPLYGKEIAVVQADGTFQFDQLAAGWVSLESSLSPESRRKIRFASIPRLKAGENQTLDASQSPRMVPAVVVRQRLIKSDTDDGIPNSKLRVLWGDAIDDGSWNQSQALRTDAEGWWMARVMPGEINVRPGSIPDGYRSTAWFDGRQGRLGVYAIVPATDEVVTLPPERYVPAVELRGRLRYADGSPAKDWSVNGHPVSWDDLGLGGARTEQDGSFVLKYPTGYPPRLFNATNREWMAEHAIQDRYVIPEVISDDPLVLEISEPKTKNAD